MTEQGPLGLGVRPGQHPEVMTFAVAEAVRRGCALRVLHVTDSPEAGATLLDDVRQAVLAAGDTVDVELQQLTGTPVEALLAASTACSVLVVGADDAPWAARTMGAEIARPVAERADCPVVVVPRTRLAGRSSTGVVVAVDGSEDIEGQLSFAFRTAARQGEPLVVLYASGLITDYPTRTTVLCHLEDAVDRWRTVHPEVTARTVVEAGHVVQACVSASANASVLVVGQPARDHHRLLSRAVATRLLRRSAAPVAVVPLTHAVAGRLDAGIG